MPIADDETGANPDHASAQSEPDAFTESQKWHPGSQSGAQNSGALYALGTIGALIWFLGRAKGPKGYVVGVLKSAVWPAYLVFGLFRALSRED